jgi:hypothetical protein
MADERDTSARYRLFGHDEFHYSKVDSMHYYGQYLINDNSNFHWDLNFAIGVCWSRNQYYTRRKFYGDSITYLCMCWPSEPMCKSWTTPKLTEYEDIAQEKCEINLMGKVNYNVQILDPTVAPAS